MMANNRDSEYEAQEFQSQRPTHQSRTSGSWILELRNGRNSFHYRQMVLVAGTGSGLNVSRSLLPTTKGQGTMWGTDWWKIHQQIGQPLKRNSTSKLINWEKFLKVVLKQPNQQSRLKIKDRSLIVRSLFSACHEGATCHSRANGPLDEKVQQKKKLLFRRRRWVRSSILSTPLALQWVSGTNDTARQRLNRAVSAWICKFSH